MKPSLLLIVVLGVLGTGAFFLGLFGRRQRPPEVPEWASFFSPDEYARFLGLVERYFREKSLPVEIADGIVTPLRQSDDMPQQMGLQNVAQLCRQAAPGNWKQVIAEHFDLLQASGQESAELESKLGDFDSIRDLLAVRLYPPEYAAQPGAPELLFREDLPGTITALVYDLAHSIRVVTRADAGAWQRKTEGLFAIGLANTRRGWDLRVERIELGEGVSVFGLSGQSFLVSTAALMLEDFPQCLGAQGAIVAVPNRGGVLAYPIDGPEVIVALKAILPIVPRMYEEGPGSISPKVYWYHQGRYVQLPYELEAGTLHFRPPDEFTEMLNRLCSDEP